MMRGQRRQGVAAYTFANAEAAAYVARMTVQPTYTRKGLIDTLVGALKAAGVFGKFDGLWLLASHDAQAARLNLVSNSYNLTAVSTPTFTVDQGYKGDGASSYLKTGFVPSTAGGHYTLNSAHLAGWNRDDTQDDGAVAGARANANANEGWVTIRNTANQSLARINQNSNIGTGASTNSSGLIVARRSDASNKAVFRNGAQIWAATAASGGVPNYEVYIGALNNGGVASSFNSRQMAAASIGGSLDDGDIASYYGAINTYLQGIGAA